LNSRSCTRSLPLFFSFRSVSASRQMRVCLPIYLFRRIPIIWLQVRPLAAYFIMNNRIYQSPDVYTVLSNRLVGFLFYIYTIALHPSTCLAYISFCPPILSRYSAETPTRLYPTNGVRVAYHRSNAVRRDT
jgi:hypothetical protein